MKNGSSKSTILAGAALMLFGTATAAQRVSAVLAKPELLGAAEIFVTSSQAVSVVVLQLQEVFYRSLYEKTF